MIVEIQVSYLLLAKGDYSNEPKHLNLHKILCLHCSFWPKKVTEALLSKESNLWVTNIPTIQSTYARESSHFAQFWKAKIW